MSLPTASILIVTYNSAGEIAACLEALRRLEYAPAPQVIVLDNASADGSADLVAERFPEATLLREPRNSGFAGGVNRAARHATGELIALLNPDAVVAPGWLAALAEALDEPGVGIAGSKILDAGGKRLKHTGGLLARPLALTEHRGDGEEDRGQYEVADEVPFVTGAALALRRDLWLELGGFDEGYFPAYFEDLDLCLRVQARGLACRYVPGAIVRHGESLSSGGKYSAAFYYFYLRGRLRFVCRHFGWPELWGGFCPAEARRLLGVSPAERAAAALAYQEGLPGGLRAPNEAEQEAILANAAALREAERAGTIGADPALEQQLGVLRAEAVLREHEFQSGIPGLAALRRLWNSVATRWYVLPALHQQTRYNLAASRALDRLAAVAGDGLPVGAHVYQAALLFRIGQLEARLAPESASRSAEGTYEPV